jgi:hypothetical protein
MTERAWIFATSDTEGAVKVMKSSDGASDFFYDFDEGIEKIVTSVDGLVDYNKPSVYRVSIHIEKVFDIP